MTRFLAPSFAILAFVAATALNACSNGGTNVVSPAQPQSGATSPAGVTPTPVATATSSGKATATPSPSPTPVSTPTANVRTGTHIYVVNETKVGATGQTPSVEVFAATASGNVAPTATIAGSNTGFGFPQFISVDASGNIFVTNKTTGSGSDGTVSEFAPAADGNVAPNAQITGLDTPEGVYVDAVGDIYVDTVNAINEYAAGTTGSVPMPMRTIGAAPNAMTNNTGVSGPYGLRVDAAGNIYVAQEEAIYVFGATQSGNVAPKQNIAGQAALFASDLDVAYDASGNIYCTNYNLGTINEYAAGSTGNSAPTNVIKSPNLDEPVGIALDANGNIYVANYGNNSIVVFAAGTTGTATGTVISGAATGLVNPFGIAVH